MQTQQVFDANGNPVTGHSALCDRCGAHIKYVFPWEGKTYGSTCIEAVSGIRPDKWTQDRDGRYNEVSTVLVVEKEKAEREQMRLANEELEWLRDANHKTNQVKYVELINVLKNESRYQGDFCSEMARLIEYNRFSTNLDDALSDRQIMIIQEIWGKVVGGRKNSKAYNLAVAEFDKKFDPQD